MSQQAEGYSIPLPEEIPALLAAVPDDLDRAVLLSTAITTLTEYLGLIREYRDDAIMDCLAAGFSPRQVGDRLGLSKTKVLNVRQEWLRNIEEHVDHRRHEIVYWSRNGTIRYVSKTVSELGWEPKEWVGRDIEDFTHPDDYAVLLPLREEAQRRGFGRYRVHLRLRHKFDHWHRYAVESRGITDPRNGTVEIHARLSPLGLPPELITES